MSRPSRRELLASAALGALAPLALRADAAAPRFPFYAMDTGLVGPDVPALADKIRLLADLGFAGVGYTLDHRRLPQALELLDKHKLQLWAVYTTPSIEAKPDPALAASVRRMKGRPTRIELALTSRTRKPSDPAGDADALRLLKHASDLAADTGPVVSVYPHRAFWAERAEDGLRLARKAARKNVGTHFNLVHWKWARPARPAPALLRDLLPHLKCVTVNGLKGDAIAPLDEGDFDVAALARALADAGYKGPVGLQGYGVKGRSADHLRRSLRKWNEIQKAIPA